MILFAQSFLNISHLSYPVLGFGSNVQQILHRIAGRVTVEHALCSSGRKARITPFLQNIWFDGLAFLYSIVLLGNCLSAWQGEVLEFNSLFEHHLLKWFSSRRISCMHNLCCESSQLFRSETKVSILTLLGGVVLFHSQLLEALLHFVEIFRVWIECPVNSQGITERLTLV